MTVRRATGEASFAGDLALPGTLHLALRRSPLAHARVTRVDAAAARGMPGVVAVLTPEDAEGLLSPVLRFHGDRLVLGAAEDVELARRATDAVEIELEQLPAVLDPEAALEDEAHVAARLTTTVGDPEAALSGAEHVVAGEWRVPFAPGVPLEPPVAITWLDEDRRLVVRTSAEAPFRVRATLADRLGVPAARIRVVRPLVAGGSPGRAPMVVEDLCALVTLRTGRPARLALSAEEELTTTPGRPAERVKLRLGLREGRIVALDLQLLVDLGADRDAPGAGLLRAAARHVLGVYRLPNVRLAAAAVRTHHPPASAPRGADAVGAFALECAVNEAAALLDEDAVAFRRRHLRSPDDPGAEQLAELGEPAQGGDARAIADLLPVADRRGRRWRLPLPAGPLRPGTAVAVARRGAAVEAQASAAASLRLLDDGSFTLAIAPSSGGSDEAAYSEAAAAILGVPPRRVVCAGGDTDSAPFETGEPASAYFAAGRAVEEAARQAVERMRAAAAALLGVPASETRVADGRVLDSAGRAISFADVGTAALRAGEPFVVTAAPSPAAAPPALAAAFAEVDVDAETGVVRIGRLEAMVAGGPFTDPGPAQVLVEGALALAVEQALAGGLPFDAAGRPLVRSFRLWPLVTAHDVPPLSVRFVPSRNAALRFGAAALGEAAGRAALAAIASAVARATGGAVRELPLSPPRVLEALDAARR
jgi:putative selenate reductase molybdopterin-binding subunit